MIYGQHGRTFKIKRLSHTIQYQWLLLSFLMILHLAYTVYITKYEAFKLWDGDGQILYMHGWQTFPAKDQRVNILFLQVIWFLSELLSLAFVPWKQSQMVSQWMSVVCYNKTLFKATKSWISHNLCHKFMCHKNISFLFKNLKSSLSCGPYKNSLVSGFGLWTMVSQFDNELVS